MQWCFSQANAVVGSQAAWDLRRRRRRGGLCLLREAAALLFALCFLLAFTVHRVLFFLRDPRLLSQG